MKYLFIMILCVASCKPSTPSLEEKRAEVMKIHDDAMAKMGKVRNSALALEEIIKVNEDSLVIKRIIQDLEQAEEGMMVWMEKYKEPEGDLEAFYQSEKEKIQQVADDINKSLEDAQKYIDL